MLLLYFSLFFIPSKAQFKPFFLFTYLFIFFYFSLHNLFSTGENFFYNHFRNLRIDWLSFTLLWASFWVVLFSGILYPYLYSKYCLFIQIFFFVFISTNLLFFFISFEFTLFPIFLLLFFLRAYKERYFSLIYFFIYTSLSRIPLFIIIFFILQKGVNSFIYIMNQDFNTLFMYFFFFILLGFIAKIPIFRLHFWLPKAHVDAPTRGSIILARILLKLRGYRFLRRFFLIKNLNGGLFFLVIIRVVGFFFSSNICLRLVDYKVIVAYSSVSHISLAFSALLLSSFLVCFKRAFFLLIRHAIVSPIIFFFSQVFFDSHNTRSIKNIKSIKKRSFFFYFFFFCVLINLRLPPFINFIGEFYILWGFYNMSILRIFFFFLRFISNRVFSVYLLRAVTHRSNKIQNNQIYNLVFWIINRLSFFIIIYFTILCLFLNKIFIIYYF